MLVTGSSLLLADSRTAMLGANTLYLVAYTSLISVPVGVIVALLLVRTDLPLRRAWYVVFATTLFIPLYLQTAAWDAGFGRTGWLVFARGDMDLPPLRGWKAAIWIHSMAAIPWVILIVSAGLRQVEREWEETALLDGTGIQVASRVTLRQALLSIVVAVLWIAVSTAGEIAVTDIYAVRTYAEEIYVGITLGDDMVESWRTVFPAIPIIMTLTIGSVVLVANLTPSEVSHRDSPRSFSLGFARWPSLLIVLAVAVMVVGVPVGNLIYKAGLVVNQTGGQRDRSWSLQHFLMIMDNSVPEFSSEIKWTILVGCIAATSTLILAVALAWLGCCRGGAALVPLLVSAICLATPGPQIGRLTIWLMNQESIAILVWLYDKTVAAPVFALTIRCLPLATLILWHAFRSIPADLLDSASLDGFTKLQQLRILILPQRKAALAVAWIACLVIAMGDVSASVLVVPPGMELVPKRVLGLLHYGVEDRLAGLCLVMIALFCSLGIGLLAIVGRSSGNWFRPEKTNPG